MVRKSRDFADNRNFPFYSQKPASWPYNTDSVHSPRSGSLRPVLISPFYIFLGSCRCPILNGAPPTFPYAFPIRSNNVKSRLKVINLNAVTASELPYCIPSCRSYILFSTLFSTVLNLCSSFKEGAKIHTHIKKTNLVARIRKRTIPTETPPLVGEVSANSSR
jgi:hypothetical protein